MLVSDSRNMIIVMLIIGCVWLNFLKLFRLWFVIIMIVKVFRFIVI